MIFLSDSANLNAMVYFWYESPRFACWDISKNYLFGQKLKTLKDPKDFLDTNANLSDYLYSKLSHRQ